MLKNAFAYFLPVIGVITFLILSFIAPVKFSAAGTRNSVTLMPSASGTSASRKVSTSLGSNSAAEQNQLGYDLRNMVQVIGFEKGRGTAFEKSSVVTPNGITRPVLCPACDPFCVRVLAPPCKAPPLTVFAAAFTVGPPICSYAPIDVSFSVIGPDGKPVPLFATDTLGMVAVKISEVGEYTIDATDKRGNKVSGTLKGLIPCCSFSQTGWSQKTAKFNGQKRWATIRGILGSSPLYVGVKGLRSLAFPKHATSCILSRLPASGDPMPLPKHLGDATMSPADSCKTSPRLPMINGKLQNELLGNVLALKLNLELDEDIGQSVICESMVVYKALPGADGVLGTDDDIIDPGPDGILGTPDDQIQTIAISPNVITALSVLHLPRTVRGLSALANTALAGEIQLGDASLPDISTAVSMINTAFTQCGFFFTCATGKSRANLQVSPPIIPGLSASGWTVIGTNNVTCSGFPYTVTLDEYGDAGITITRFTVDYYSAGVPDETTYLFTESFNSDDFANLFNKCNEANNHIAPGGRACGTLCAPFAASDFVTQQHALIVNFYGTDDDGIEVSFTTPPVSF